MNVNFRSAAGKRAEIGCMIDSVKPDIIFGTETWLNEDIKDNEIIPDNYTVYRKDRNREGGGVLLAIRQDLKSSEEPDLMTDCELIWASIKLTGRKTLYLCAYYRRDVSDENSLKEFRASLTKVASIRNAQLIIGGDMNFCDWDWARQAIKPGCKHTRLHNEFMELIRDHGMEQMVLEPTRGSNTLDLIVTNIPHQISRVEVIPGLSDHDIVYCELSSNVQKIRQPPRKIPMYGKADWEGIKTKMKQLQVDMENQENRSTEELWTMFKETYTAAVEEHIPHKQARPKSSKPWVTPEIKKLISRRARVYKQMKKSGSEELRAESRHLRSTIQRKLRRSYWNYINQALTEPAPDESPSLKKFWSFIKHQRTSKTGVSPLKVNGKLFAEPKEKAEILNSQFQAVFSEGKEYTQEEFKEKCPMEETTCNPLTNISISEEGVRKLLSDLNPYKASGPDQIAPRVLKEIATEVAPVLTKIYQASLTTGTVPADWKKANIAPVFKKGEHYNPANYRPVSLTSIPCKILEHIIVKKIMDHLENNAILCPQQHGFRKKRSCETQLLELVDELAHNMEGGAQTDIVIMDFAKAFDKVNHSLLLHKLHHYGVQGSINQWIQSFLRDRTQAVVVEGAVSDSAEVKSGVPQGSVLGPCLFLAYINDLPDRLTSLTRLFADDTAVYRLVSTIQDQDQLQKDLQTLQEWEKSWDMQFHPGKCTTLPVTRKREPMSSKYQLHGHTLEEVCSAKYLGVTITNNLSWDTHINTICAKANKTLGFLRRNLKISATQLKATAYKTIVRPILEYASTVWDPYTTANETKLESIQKRAARFVTGRYHNTSKANSLITTLGWEPLKQRRKINRLAMVYKISHGMVCMDSSQLVPAPTRERRGHSQQFRMIQCRTKYRQGAFLPRSIKDWNELPDSVVEARTLDTFVSRARKI